jgi:uncharacterized membrane protein YccC
MRLFRHVVPLTVLLAVIGCKQFKATPSNDPETAKSEATARPANLEQHIRNNCASLLHDLLNDEKHLDKILIIKRESDELHQLVKRISETAAARATQLEEMSKTDRSLNLLVTGLPSGEAATREAISKTKRNELLQSKGADFELKLLMTQLEALNYGAHLAKVAAENESRPENIRVFSGIQSDFEKLYREVRDRFSVQHR